MSLGLEWRHLRSEASLGRRGSSAAEASEAGAEYSATGLLIHQSEVGGPLSEAGVGCFQRGLPCDGSPLGSRIFAQIGTAEGEKQLQSRRW